MTVEEILNGKDTTHDKEILDAARRGVFDTVKGINSPPEKSHGPVMGVFVTVNENSALRGCIGFPETNNGIFYQTYMAAGYAATEDPRFEPITVEELSRISIEVTLLSPPVPVNPLEWKDFKKGLHGVIVRRGMRSGLLLPQVAVEYDLNWKDFLEEVCHKAGLPTDSYLSSNAEVLVFSGRIISDY